MGYQGYVAVITEDFKMESYQWIKDNISDRWNKIIFTGSKFVAVGEPGRSIASIDGLSWSRGQASAREDVAYGNGGFVAVGGGVITKSADGRNWKYISVNSTYNWRAIINNRGMYVVVGDNGYITTSTEGEVWTTPTQLKDELGNVVTTNLLQVCTIP